MTWPALRIFSIKQVKADYILIWKLVQGTKIIISKLSGGYPLKIVMNQYTLAQPGYNT